MTMHFLYYLIPALLVFRYYNYLRVKNECLKTQNQLLNLGTELRFLTYSDKNLSKSPSFLYLEHLIGNSMEPLRKLNFWLISYYIILEIVLHLKTGGHPKENPITELRKDERLNKIYCEFLSILKRHVIVKSLFSLTFFGWAYKVSKAVKNNKISFYAAKFNEKIMFVETGEYELAC